jgi:hypothetical protein
MNESNKRGFIKRAFEFGLTEKQADDALQHHLNGLVMSHLQPTSGLSMSHLNLGHLLSSQPVPTPSSITNAATPVHTCPACVIHR